MNTQNRYGLWISNTEQLSKIDHVKNNLTDIEDIFIISDENIVEYNYGIISTFYVHFDNCNIVFMSVDDLIENRNYLRADKLYLCCSKDEIINSQIDKNYLKNVKVIEI